MNEAALHMLEPGQHVIRRVDQHELQVLEVEPTGEVWAWDLDAQRATRVSGWSLEPVAP